MHGHEQGVSHLCVVARGRVEIVVGEKKFERAVGIYNLPADIKHGVTALDDDTIFYNVF